MKRVWIIILCSVDNEFISSLLFLSPPLLPFPLISCHFLSIHLFKPNIILVFVESLSYK